ncbi:hypothetical protein BJX76DRAFT_344543 [Aspergillus varians]
MQEPHASRSLHDIDRSFGLILSGIMLESGISLSPVGTVASRRSEVSSQHVFSLAAGIPCCLMITPHIPFASIIMGRPIASG